MKFDFKVIDNLKWISAYVIESLKTFSQKIKEAQCNEVHSHTSVTFSTHFIPLYSSTTLQLGEEYYTTPLHLTKSNSICDVN